MASVENSSNGLIFWKKRAKNGHFFSLKAGEIRIFQEKNGRFQVLLFPSSLQYLQCFRSTLKQDYPSHGLGSLFYCDLCGLL